MKRGCRSGRKTVLRFSPERKSSRNNLPVIYT
jgi:hypothetical protein